jgi:hypothetical protein
MTNFKIVEIITAQNQLTLFCMLGSHSCIQILPKNPAKDGHFSLFLELNRQLSFSTISSIDNAILKL